MKITSIQADRDSIFFHLDGKGKDSGACHVEAVTEMGAGELAEFEGSLSPSVSGDAAESEKTGRNSTVRIPRYAGKKDLLTAEFRVIRFPDRAVLKGPRYVTDPEKISANRKPYPVFRTKKTLSGEGNGYFEDYAELGVEQTILNVNLPAFMTFRRENTVSFWLDGEEYLFRKDRVEKLDRFMREQKAHGLSVTVILLNSPRLFHSLGEEEFLQACIHPSFDWSCSNAYISAFPAYDREGQKLYRAFVEFLASRYTQEDEMGALVGMIVSNEVNSQYIWGNAGEKSCRQYMEEYTKILRLTWLCVRKYSLSVRVYISLDHLFNISYNEGRPRRYYRGREVLERLEEFSGRDGDFGWSIAYHCYPENLEMPDFYNDRTAQFNFSTQRITFKNIEILSAFLGQEKFLYQGKPRRIILSEQGFNSDNTELLEQQGAAAYCLAYEKIRAIPTIDMFMHHAYADNQHEFGLHLGIRAAGEDGRPGRKRPVWYSMRDMDTDAEAEAVQKARAFIGDLLYERILHPEITVGEDTKDRSQFGEE